MANMVLASPEYSDAASITGAPTPGDFGVANLLRPGIRDTCQFSSTGSMFVDLDLGAPRTVNLAWMGYVTAGPSCQYRVANSTASLAALATSPSWDSGLRDHWAGGPALTSWPSSHASLWLGSSPQTARYWRFSWVDSSPLGGALSLARIYLSFAWEPSEGMRYDFASGYLEEPILLESQAGLIIAGIRRRRRWAEFTLRLRSESELRARSLELGRTRGLSQDVLWIADPEGSGLAYQQDTVCGLFKEAPPFRVPTHNIFDSSYRIEEL